jgi:hypothetical protein
MPNILLSLPTSKRIGIQQLATRSMDDALRSFEGVLADKPTNLVALLGKVCQFMELHQQHGIQGHVRPESSMVDVNSLKRSSYSNKSYS